MVVFQRKGFFICLFFLVLMIGVYASADPVHPNPVAAVANPCRNYSLVNSVEFHPKENLFCHLHALQ